MILQATALLLNIGAATFCWYRVGKQQAIREVLNALSKAYGCIGRQGEIIERQQEAIGQLYAELQAGRASNSPSSEEIAEAADKYIGHAHDIDEPFEVGMRRDAFKDGARWALRKRQANNEQANETEL